MGSFIPGQHAQIQCVFWSINDMSDGGNCDVMGLPRTRDNNAESQVLIAVPGPFFETAERIIDGA
eukprot:9361934-Pyramimonas_sp.AAC.1